jgi:hypothetical protein
MSEIDLRKVLEQGRAHEASLNIPERTYSVVLSHDKIDR